MKINLMMKKIIIDHRSILFNNFSIIDEIGVEYVNDNGRILIKYFEDMGGLYDNDIIYEAKANYLHIEDYVQGDLVGSGLVYGINLLWAWSFMLTGKFFSVILNNGIVGEMGLDVTKDNIKKYGQYSTLRVHSGDESSYFEFDENNYNIQAVCTFSTKDIIETPFDGKWRPVNELLKPEVIDKIYANEYL